MIARHLHRHSARYVALLALAVPATLLSGVTHEAHASGSEPLLPDLVADPPDGIGIAADSSTGSNRLLLRFNGYIHNKGPGAVDFRGSRVAPKLSAANEKKVKEAEEKNEGLPQGIEEELAASPMKAFQRLFTTNVGEEEDNIERAHKDESSPAELIFASADGHHHWHLQHAAKYSLWNLAKTAEVAPAQKVGFCLDDSGEQHVEPSKGPAIAAYSDATGRDFCQQYKPNATSLFEGISPGWRDLYSRELAFQWVDASNVLPGEYWLREEVNPLGVVKETGGANVPVYAAKPTTIEGFDAVASSSLTAAGKADALTLSSTKWGGATNPVYAIVSQPQHGTLSAINQGKLTYTPSAGYSGKDSFSFSAHNPSSPFPTSPAVATVSIEVGEGEGAPAVAIEGAPESIVAGTSVQLSAHVTNDSPTVTWQASAGAVTPGGLYTAPSEPGSVTVTATTSKGTKEHVTINVLALPPDEPAPESPPESPHASPGGSTTATNPGSAPTVTNPASGGQQPGTVGTLGSKTSTARIAVSRPVVELVGRTLVMTDRAGAPGRIRLSAYLGNHRLGTCATLTPAGRSFTCRVSLPKNVSLRARIRVVASLRDGAALVSSVRAAAPVAPMRMGAHASSFWCSPGSLHLL